MSPHLLSLPPELRLRIYFYLIPNIPLSSPATQFTGLLYSCKYIRSELEPEIIKLMFAFLRSVQDRTSKSSYANITFDTPHKLGDVLNLRVERDSGPGAIYARDDPFIALLYMHLSSLTIQLPRFTPSDTSPPTPHARHVLPSQTRRLIPWIHALSRPATERSESLRQGQNHTIYWKAAQTTRGRHR
ncbi:hypothetical protein CC80DRAFT_155578 [Byssothecium circinans]|uniref:F-box domain-containing protein n=1 Tax=Byssothecium circinans TaxID=147558 RepID=A0A6A5UGU0_9PLEO|nr:hypothetical protein CC80DRAFT_155578 [Byssothecium circinans]